MADRLVQYAHAISGNVHDTIDAYDYQDVINYNKIRIRYVVNGYVCGCLQDAQQQRRHRTDKIYMYCNDTVTIL